MRSASSWRRSLSLSTSGAPIAARWRRRDRPVSGPCRDGMGRIARAGLYSGLDAYDRENTLGRGLPRYAAGAVARRGAGQGFRGRYGDSRRCRTARGQLALPASATTLAATAFGANPRGRGLSTVFQPALPLDE